MDDMQDMLLIEQLRTTLGKLETALGHIKEPILWTDEAGIIQWCNVALDHLIGRPHIEILGGNIRELLPLKHQAQDVEWESHPIKKAIASRSSISGTYQALQKKRNVILEITTTYLSFTETEINIIVVLRDITKEQQQLKHIRVLATYPTENPEPVLRVNPRGKILFRNKASEPLTSYWRYELEETLPDDITSLVVKCYNQGQKETIDISIDSMFFSLLFSPQQELGYVNIYGADITKRKQIEEQLRHMARHDILTDLPNRQQFDAILKRELAIAKQHRKNFTVLLLNIDNFKAINDTHSHQIGDLLLQEVANRLKFITRTEDFLARMAGDEFVIILTEISAAHKAGLLTKQLLHALNEPYLLTQQKIQITISAGIANYPDAGSKVTDLIKNADIALRDAKNSGRNNYQFFSPTLGQKHHQQLQLEHYLHEAIDKEQLFLVYQPIYSLPSKQVIGVEALLRWQHPEQGLISPEIFIPIAERRGFMTRIGEWVLRHACKEFVIMCSQYKDPCKLAINVSPYQLLHGHFVETVSDTLETTGMSPQQLELELIESAIMTNLGDSDVLLTQLQNLGISIAIDDFGTGYSSLSRLKDLPIHTLKIDRLFVQDTITDRGSALIVKSILTLADSLGLNVIAEGVETKQQLQFLIENNCPCVQGFYFSKPLSAKDATHLLIKQQKNG